MTFGLKAALKGRKKEKFPDKKDVEGAALGLVKLWTQYRYE